jgi:gamma-glutamyl phosphate reductase
LNLADRVADAEYLSSNLDDRLDVTEDHVSSLQDHVNKLLEQADALTPVLRDSTVEALAQVKAGVAALNALVTGQCALVHLYTIADFWTY